MVVVEEEGLRLVTLRAVEMSACSVSSFETRNIKNVEIRDGYETL
jgi:hypothetical protein